MYLQVLKQPRCRTIDIDGVHTAEIIGGSVSNSTAQDFVVESFLQVSVREQVFTSQEQIPLFGEMPAVRLRVPDSRGEATPSLAAIPDGPIRCEWSLRVLPPPLEPPPSGQPPRGPGARIGVAYHYSLHTHCGVHAFALDGRWWTVKPAFADPWNAPPGWNVNDESGTITLLAPSRAVFRPDARGGMDEPGGPKATAYLVPGNPPEQGYDTCE